MQSIQDQKVEAQKAKSIYFSESHNAGNSQSDIHITPLDIAKCRVQLGKHATYPSKDYWGAMDELREELRQKKRELQILKFTRRDELAVMINYQ